jgi:hypothetical protein
MMSAQSFPYGEVLSRSLRKGQLRPLLTEMSGKTFEDYRGCSRQMAFKTLEEWLYKYRNGGFEALKPQPRSDQGQSRVLTPDLEQLVVDLKQEDAGRSAPLILRGSGSPDESRAARHRFRPSRECCGARDCPCPRWSWTFPPAIAGKLRWPESFGRPTPCMVPC